MVATVTALRLAGYALGAFGAVLVFLEFFQQPNYIRYDAEIGSYSVDFSPANPREYTLIGRIGALAIASAFALEFFAVFLGA